jgi:uncharacterized protein
VNDFQVPRVVLTDAARELLKRVRSERGDGLSLVIGNGCCDATAPYLFADYLPGPNEHEVGSVEDVSVFIDESVSAPFTGTEIVVDARDDPQPDSFSCEAELGYRFVLDRLPAG